MIVHLKNTETWESDTATIVNYGMQEHLNFKSYKSISYIYFFKEMFIQHIWDLRAWK